MSFADLVHRLCREPHSFKPHEIRELTVFQARNILQSRDNEVSIPPLPNMAGGPAGPPAMRPARGP